jgi:hypothetical protein
MMKRRFSGLAGAVVLVVAMGLIPAASVIAAEPTDTVRVWNSNAILALGNPGTATPPGLGEPPPVASIHLAMVQGAVYDAVNAIDGGHQSYLNGLPATSSNASKAAAVATAAHHVLVGLNVVPAMPQNVTDSLNAQYVTSLATITPDDQAKTDGIAIGAAVAAAMLVERADDGRFVPYSFTSAFGPGDWRAEPPNGSDPFAWVSNVRPFTMKSTGQFRTAGPLDLSSGQYAAEFNEVKTLGALTGSGRTDAQTLQARFYSANPLPMMNRAFREISVAEGLSLVEEARLFAMLGMAGADALIGCWDDKDYWSFWRPQTAIREAAGDDNPNTSPPPAGETWLPLIASGTAPYPEHPSGYNCYAGAMMHAGKHYFGDKVSFVLNSPVTGTSRSYDRFTDVLVDTIDARVWLGLHFRTPDVKGAWLGKRVANWSTAHFFK